ncbi:hypothetical protein [Streptomyces sp. bgisy027]|uniref:hypothetical protein n=1 Tax=unclassified Streptomyces TaxID=2593676 RepID=UPI003D75A43C
MADWRQAWQSILDALRVPPSGEAGQGDAATAALAHDLAAAGDTEVARRFEQLGTKRHEREIERLNELGNQERQRLWTLVCGISASCLVVTVCGVLLLCVVCYAAVLVVRAAVGLEISVPPWAAAAVSYTVNAMITGVMVVVSTGVIRFARRRRARASEQPPTDPN